MIIEYYYNYIQYYLVSICYVDIINSDIIINNLYYKLVNLNRKRHSTNPIKMKWNQITCVNFHIFFVTYIHDVKTIERHLIE